MLFELSATVSTDNIDLLSELFFALGAETVTLSDAKDEPLFQVNPEDQPHWQHTTVCAIFDEHCDTQAIIANIQKNHRQFSTLKFSTKKLENKNWVLETQKQFHAQSFGKVWVCPQWEKDSFQKTHPNATVIYIEPGLAFGTGTHPTTQLCLEWLAHHDLNNKIVVDYGCGSGILALTACALHAKTVIATDHDAQALEATHNNQSYNDFDETLLILRTTNDLQDIKADVIVANILADTLIDLAPTLSSLLQPHGILVLSGILAHDADRVLSAYRPYFKNNKHVEKEEWLLMALQ